MKIKKPYRSLKKLTDVLTIIFIVNAIASLFEIIPDIQIIKFLQSGAAISDPPPLPPWTVAIFILQALSSLTLLVLFCIWVHRASSNAWNLTPDSMHFSPGWAVGWFFIPIANFYKPYQALREIWISSRPSSETVPPKFLLTWWIIFLLSEISINFQNPTLTESRARWLILLGIVGIVLQISRSILATLFIRKVTINQDQKRG